MGIKVKHLLTKTLAGSSAEQLTTDTSQIYPAAYLQAALTNTGNVIFGDSTLSSGNGAEFAAGDGMIVGGGDPAQGSGWVNLAHIYVMGTAGDKVKVTLLERV